MSQPNRPTGPAVTLRTPGMGGAQAPAVNASLSDPSQYWPLATLVGLSLLLLYAYADMLSLTMQAWSDPLYSHGYIIPIFALGLLWLRWQPFKPVPISERWLGLAILIAALCLRLFGIYMTMNPIDRVSLLPALFGLVLMVGGWHTVRWAWPALLFLAFMFPLPSVVEQNVLWKLQSLASWCSTVVLQTLGISAFREGNVIKIPGSVPLNIADACSGLRMATIFGALALAMVFLIDRPWWDKFVILLSAIPIALAVNVIRITITGLLYMVVGHDNELAHKLSHDWAGYFMMPLALGFLWIELQILERVTVPVEVAQVRPMAGRAAAVPIR
jgi:exosortase